MDAGWVGWVFSPLLFCCHSAARSAHRSAWSKRSAHIHGLADRPEFTIMIIDRILVSCARAGCCLGVFLARVCVRVKYICIILLLDG